jgi:hypothetical protein
MRRNLRRRLQELKYLQTLAAKNVRYTIPDHFHAVFM